MIDKISTAVVGALLALLLAIGLQAMALKKENNSLQSQITDLKTTVATKEADVKSLLSNSKSKDELIAEYRKFFSDYDAATDQKTQELKAAIKAVEDKVNKNVSLSNKLLAATPETNDMCVEANRLINEYLTEIHNGVEPQ